MNEPLWKCIQPFCGDPRLNHVVMTSFHPRTLSNTHTHIDKHITTTIVAAIRIDGANALMESSSILHLHQQPGQTSDASLSLMLLLSRRMCIIKRHQTALFSQMSNWNHTHTLICLYSGLTGLSWRPYGGNEDEVLGIGF